MTDLPPIVVTPEEFAELRRENRALQDANLDLESQIRETAQWGADLFQRVYALTTNPLAPALVAVSEIRKALELEP